MDLADFLSKIDWDNIQRIHASRNGKFYSFAVDVDRRRHIVTVGIGPSSTTLTIADTRGRILTHAVQEGHYMTFFTPQTGSAGAPGKAGRSNEFLAGTGKNASS